MSWQTLAGLGFAALGSLAGSSSSKSGSGTSRITDDVNIFNDPNFKPFDSSLSYDAWRKQNPNSSPLDYAKYVAQAKGKVQGLNGIPESIYYSQLMNIYNQGKAREMLERENEMSQENYEKYMSPQALSRQYAAAGLNPALVMNGNSAGSVASSSQQASQGSVNAESIGAEAQKYAADSSSSSSFQNNMTSLLTSGADIVAQSSFRDSATHKQESEAVGTDIDNTTRNLENLAKIRELISRTDDQDAKAKYQSLENEILANTQVSQENIIRNKEAGTYNDLLLQQDTHDLNQYEKTKRYFEGQLLQANLKWLDKEKAATLSLAYSQAKYFGASATKAIAEAEKAFSESYGIQLTNEQRKDLDGAFRDAQRNQYQAIKVAVDDAKVQLEKARYEKDHQSITYWNNQVKTLTESYKNVTIGTGALIKGAQAVGN